MLRACLVALVLGAGSLWTVSASAQADEEGLDAPAAPGEEAEEPEPEVSEPEPEVSDEPEPEVSRPRPNNANPNPRSGAEQLGRAAAEPTVEEDLAEATTEGEEPAPTEGRRRRGRTNAGTEEGLEEASAENRLASANPTAGLPWSMPIVYTNTITTRTLRPGAQRTYNPYWNMSLSIRPRWNFTPALSVGARVDVDLELTDAGHITNYSNPVNGNNQVYWQDLRLDVTYSQGLGAGFSLTPSMQIRVPTSTFSRGDNRILGLAPSLMLMRPTPTENVGVFIPGLIAGYVYWITNGNVGDPMRRDEEPVDDEVGEYVIGNARTTSRCAATGSQGGIPDGGDCQDGAGTRQHQLALTGFVTWVPGGGVNISAFYSGIWLRGAQLGDACLGENEDVINASGDPRCWDDGSDTKWVVFGQFGISVGYDFTPYLTGTLSYSTLAVHPDTDGNGIENPFWNENATIALSFQLRPAALAVKLRADRAAAEAAEGGEEAAIVRPTAF